MAILLGLSIAGAILVAWPLALFGGAFIAVILILTLGLLAPEYKFHSLLQDKADSEFDTLEDSNAKITRYLVKNIQDGHVTSMAVETQGPQNAVAKTIENTEREGDSFPVNAEAENPVLEISGKDGASAYMNHLKFIHNYNRLLPLIPYELDLGKHSNRPATYNYQ